MNSSDPQTGRALSGDMASVWEIAGHLAGRSRPGACSSQDLERPAWHGHAHTRYERGPLILDIRRFKVINDTNGRVAADGVLRQIAMRLDAATEQSDAIAGTGPNQFAVILLRIGTQTEAAQSCERLIRHCFEAPFTLGAESMRLFARAGVAVCPDDGNDENELLRHTEEALKRGRISGEALSFYRFADGRVAELLQFEIQLRHALERNEFVLHEQPQVDARTRSLQGFEALLRWRCRRQTSILTRARGQSPIATSRCRNFRARLA